MEDLVLQPYFLRSLYLYFGWSIILFCKVIKKCLRRKQKSRAGRQTRVIPFFVNRQQGTIRYLAPPGLGKNGAAAGYRGRYRTISLPHGTRANMKFYYVYILYNKTKNFRLKISLFALVNTNYNPALI